jgi:Fe-S oxidoreductase
MGFVDDAKDFIRHNITQLKKLNIHTLLSGCPTCYHIWKFDSLEELGNYPLEVLHSTEFLERMIKKGMIQLRATDGVVTYHDPCDLGRNGGVYENPREIIKSIPGLKFVELEHRRENALCCGGGGNLQSVDPQRAAAIAQRRIEEIQETGATIVVSSCQQCEQMLSAGILDRNLKVRVMDISQLILEAMN